MDIEAQSPLQCTPRAVLFGRCAVESCNQPPLHGIPLCEPHGAVVAVYMDSHLQAKEEAAERHRQAVEADNARFKRMLDIREAKAAGTYKSDPGIIYYLRLGEHIKIGYTTDLAKRLKAYPPMSVLLATHPGTMKTEAQMHEQFAAHLAGRKEWFHVTDELEAHIERVRQQFRQVDRVSA